MDTVKDYIRAIRLSSNRLNENKTCFFSMLRDGQHQHRTRRTLDTRAMHIKENTRGVQRHLWQNKYISQ